MAPSTIVSNAATPGVAALPASLPPAERPKTKAVKNETKILKKQRRLQQLRQQQQLRQVPADAVQQQQQCQQLQQLPQLEQLYQHLQQRHLKQQNQATLAALQQNILQNQAHILPPTEQKNSTWPSLRPQQQIPPLAAGSSGGVQLTTLTRVERNNLDVDAVTDNNSAVTKIVAFSNDDINGNVQLVSLSR